VIDFAAERVVRAVRPGDLPALRAALTDGPPERFDAYLACQTQGAGAYLVAEQEGQPVGHVLVRWDVGKITGVPEVDDLFVHPDHRRRGVAGRLLAAAEAAAAKRGFRRIGLSCAVENEGARALYAGRGYGDAGLGTFVEAGRWIDADGIEQVRAEECVYLMRDLEAPATGAAVSVSQTVTVAGGPGGEHSTMTDNDEPQREREPAATAPVAEAAPPENGGGEGGEQQKEEKPLADRALDIAFGAALVAGEAFGKLLKVAADRAKELSENGPEIIKGVEEKGRPAREKFVRVVREGALRDPAPKDATVETAGAEKTQAAAQAVASAVDEIRILEERVRALEQELSGGGATAETAATEPEPAAEASVTSGDFTGEAYTVPDPAQETTADESTFVNDFTPETPTPGSLADSPYAVSETAEEVAAETAAAESSFDPEVPVADSAPEGDAPPPKRGGRRKKSEEPPAAESSFDPETGGTGEA
jgi:GNAT superfamily N-acetyltransferase